MSDKRRTVVLGLAQLLAGALGVHVFSFREAEFMRDDEAHRAVEAFIESRLPTGLSADESRARLKRAGMQCGRVSRDGVMDCTYLMPVHLGGGIVGEDAWNLRLTFSPMTALESVAVAHEIIGTGPPGIN